MDKQKKGKLYLIPTSLAENSSDKILTPKLQEVIKKIDYFLVENARTARRFISSLKLSIDIEKLQFEVLDKKTKSEDVNHLCSPLLTGIDIGVLSEAGCPGIADPGSAAVSFAHQHNINVIPMVGPSSIFLALMASGFNGQSFTFHGYLPIDKPKRSQAIKSLEKDAFKKRQTQIFMETPYRNNLLLTDILRVCQQNTRLCIAKNITGGDEQIRTKTIKEWRKSNIDLHKIPAVFLLYF